MSPTPFVVGLARAAPTNTQTRPGGVWVRLVVKTTWSPTAGFTALYQSRGTARTFASTLTSVFLVCSSMHFVYVCAYVGNGDRLLVPVPLSFIIWWRIKKCPPLKYLLLPWRGVPSANGGHHRIRCRTEPSM